MKVYIDFSKQTITKVTNQTAYEGDFESIVFELFFFNYNNTNWFPTMSQLAPNGREAGDFTADEAGTEITEDGITYLKFEFTLGTGWVSMKGISNLFVWINQFVNSKLTKKCYGKVILKLNESTDGYFVFDPYLNPSVAAFMRELMEGVAHPAGVYTNEEIADLQEDIGIVVSSTDGYWYYWDVATNEYVQGAIYQAPVYNSSNKLNADYVDDTNSTHKFVTAEQRTQIGTNATNITALQNDKADRNNSSQTIVASKVEAGTLKATSAIQYTRANYGSSSFYEHIILDTGSENVCCKKFTIPKVSDSSYFAQNWNTTDKAFFQYNDDKRELGKNNTTGIGLGLGQNNNVKPDFQIIPAFRFSHYVENYAKTSELDSLIMFRPYFVFSPLGRIYDMDKAPYVYFGYNTDSYDNTKKSVHLQAHNTSFDVNTKGVELNGSGLHFYENDKQVATQEYVNGEITTLDNDLQSQIDGINAGQNLADIVADLTALNNLPTSNLKVDDKVQVLVDSNHDNASTVYRWTGSAWSYIGKYGQDSYTKAEVNTLLDAKQDVIDASHKLNADLVDDTNATNKFVTASEKAQITTNANNISNLRTGSDLTNTLEFTKTVNQSWDYIIQNGLSSTPLISQEDFNKLNQNTVIIYNVISSVDNVQFTFYLRCESAIVNQSLNYKGTYGLETGDGMFTMEFSADNSLHCDMHLTYTQIYTREDVDTAINNSFLTDAQMTTLLSEVFD